jgi:hypothetical protein
MSEIPIDNTGEGAIGAPIEPTHHRGSSVRRPRKFRFGEETDSDFLEWSEKKRDSYLHRLYLYGEHARNPDEVELDFAVKERLTQLVRLERQFIPESSDDRFVLIRSVMLSAARRVESVRQRTKKLQNRVLLLFLSALVLIPFLVAPAWEAWLHVDRGPVVLVLGATYFLVAFLSLFALTILMARQSGMPTNVPLLVVTYLVLILSFIFIAAFVFVGLYQRDHDLGILLEFAGGVGLVTVIYSLLLWIVRSINVRLPVMYHRGHARPSEVLLIDLIDLATRASRLGWDSISAWQFRRFGNPKWLGGTRRRPVTRPFIVELEFAARRSERLFSGAMPLGHHDLRLWASDRGRRIAAVLRAHKQVFVEISELEESSVSASLLNGAVSVARADWETFLIVPLTPVVHSLVRRFGGRILLAAVLAIGALAIPWLFPSLVPPTAALEFRVTLLVTSVFTLLRPDLDKALEAFTSFR